jgi:hypothetical protein
MQNPPGYLEYAEQCEQMARNAKPEHKAVLMELAEAWRKYAQEINRKYARGKVQST